MKWSLNNWPALGSNGGGYRGPIGSSPKKRALRSPRTSFTAALGSPRTSFTLGSATPASQADSASVDSAAAAGEAAAAAETGRPLSHSPTRRLKSPRRSSAGKSTSKKSKSLSPAPKGIKARKSLRARAMQVRAAIRFKHAFGAKAFGPDAAASAAAAAAKAAGFEDPREVEGVQPEDTTELKVPNRFKARAQQVRAAIRFRSAFAAAGVSSEQAIQAAAAAVREKQEDNTTIDDGDEDAPHNKFDTDSEDNDSFSDDSASEDAASHAFSGDDDSSSVGQDARRSERRSRAAVDRRTLASPRARSSPSKSTNAGEDAGAGFLCPLCHTRFAVMESLLHHHDDCDGTPLSPEEIEAVHQSSPEPKFHAVPTLPSPTNADGGDEEGAHDATSVPKVLGQLFHSIFDRAKVVLGRPRTESASSETEFVPPDSHEPVLHRKVGKIMPAKSKLEDPRFTR